jgi:hypothetical protein
MWTCMDTRPGEPFDISKISRATISSIPDMVYVFPLPVCR